MPIDDLYDVSHELGILRLTPRADRGPGRTARLACVLAAVLGTLFLAAWLWIGFYIRGDNIFRDAPDVGPPWFVGFLCPGFVLVPLFVLLFAGAVKLYRTRRRPLVADTSGGLRYGTYEWVPIGSAVSVRVEKVSQWVTQEDGPGYERHTAHLYVETTDGRFVELPKPYFSQLDEWEPGELLGASLASVLGVLVSDEPPPAKHSTPQRNDRMKNWIMGVPFLLLGSLAFLAGVAVAVFGVQNEPEGPERWIIPVMFVGIGGLFGTLGWHWLGGRFRTYAIAMAGVAATLAVVRLL